MKVHNRPIRNLPGHVWEYAFVLLALLAMALALRLPAFAIPAIKSRDEGCFMVVGQDLLRGYLPYEHVWCNKPPLGFLFYAAALALDKGVWGVRLAGTLWVALAAFITYLSGRRISGPAGGLLAAVLVILGATYTSTGQAVMMEHVALVPLALIMWIALGPLTIARMVLLGLLISAAMLIRTNLVTLWLAAAFLCARDFRKDDLRESWARIACLVLGAAAPIACMLGLYAWHHALDPLWIGAVQVPFTFLSDQATTLAALLSAGNAWLFIIEAVTCVLTIGLIAGLARRGRSGWPRDLMTILVFFFVTVLSVVVTFAAYKHYLIQLFPSAALLSAYAWLWCRCRDNGPDKSRRVAVLIMGIAAVAACLLCREYWRQPASPPAREYTLASYLSAKGVKDRFIFSPRLPLAYVFSGALSPVGDVHPAAQTLMYLQQGFHGKQYSLRQFVHDALMHQPLVVIIDTLSVNDPVQKETLRQIATTYRFAVRIEGLDVYERRTDLQAPLQ